MGGGGGHRDVHTGGVNGMWPGGKEGQGALHYFKGECEVKDSWQGCSMGADGEEMEAVATREGRRGGSGSWGKRTVGNGLTKREERRRRKLRQEKGA